ncbi:MAG TPA: hypothetical protein VNW06_00455 [Cytophagaceae bacterium]|nr:hypothetical protein [Cytophagaceae bacterium]
MNFIKVALVLLFLGSIQFFVGCKKSKDNPFGTDITNMVRENALIEATFDDVLKVSENIMMNNGDARIATAGAPLGCITNIDSVVTGPNQKTYTATFSAACSSYDGKIRKGKIIFNLTGANYNTVGSELVVTFQDYSYDSNYVYGKMVVNNVSANTFTIKVSDHIGTGYATLSIWNPGDSTRIATQWKSLHTRYRYSGGGDNILINDKFQITTPSPNSYMEGFTSDNNHYTAFVSAPLFIDYSCRAVGMLRYPVAGRVNYFENYINNRIVDYGDSSVCDKTVTIIFDGSSESYDIY